MEGSIGKWSATLGAGEHGQSVPRSPGGARAEREWAISAGALNALWGDVFPRLVATQWLKELDEAPPSEHVVHVGMRASDLVESIEAVMGPYASDPIPGTTGTMTDRKNLVLEAFKHEKAPPFSVAGSGGYDFLLSNEGIEFFFPNRPASVRELVQYYSFRSTGRPSIGLPLYLPGPCSGMSTEAPTGPSQATADPEELMSFAELATELGLSADFLRCVTDMTSGRPIPLDSYACIRATLRSWQIEGSVFRGIMTELPRIVALAWMEVLDKTRHAPAIPANVALDTLLKVDPPPGAYYPKLFGDPNSTNAEHGLRDVFRKRLETYLPGKPMHFGVRTTAVSGLNWKKDDVMITHRGFYFPKPEFLREDGDLKRLITEIAEGRAGNPVFTDSKRTQGGGGE